MTLRNVEITVTHARGVLVPLEFWMEADSYWY